MSNEATRMYSTCFSVDPRGYCERSRRRGCAAGLYPSGPPLDNDECCDEAPVEGVLDFELESRVRSVPEDMTPAIGGCGERDGREWCDNCESDREEGKDDKEPLLVRGTPPFVYGLLLAGPLEPLRGYDCMAV